MTDAGACQDERSPAECILAGLNTQQKRAVTACASGRLQIIAGPGTGKTSVLTSRVAYLLLQEGVDPRHVIVTTFTKKAANEMMERLTQLLKNKRIDASRLLIGTFHSICFKIIKIYGSKLGISDYTIADEKDSSTILSEVLMGLDSRDLESFSRLPDAVTNIFKSNKEDRKHHGYDAKKIKKYISKLKAKGIKSQTYRNSPACNIFLSCIYTAYQEKLRHNLLLDFDDCLLSCYELISNHPVLNFVEHVLIDEFQDTNEIQLQLMYQFARGHPTNPKLQNNITIVGDPDQSIYGFREAQSINFDKMKSTYRDCQVVTLDENYRSTSDILNLSESIMRQQNSRMVKTLKSQVAASFAPVHTVVDSPEKQAKWICYQVEHLMSLPDSLFSYSDMAVLVRAAYQTRAIENEFVRRGIPYHMIKGRSFWERKEVVAVLDYLRVIANPNDRMAYLRTVCFPKKGLGDKSIELINAKVERVIGDRLMRNSSYVDTTVHDVFKDLDDVKLSSKVRVALTDHIDFIEESRKLLEGIDCHLDGASVDEDNFNDLITSFFDHVYSKSGLAAEFKQEEERDLNVMEVKRQLIEFRPPPNVRDLPTFIGGSEDDKNTNHGNFLQNFVESIGLYETDDKNKESAENDQATRGKVSLSTIHGAKGLEWPVVFVPGVSEGLLPAKFALDSGGDEAVDEERRCFYVATTRAKTLLYISSYLESFGKWGRPPIESISRFLEGSNTSSLFQKDFTNVFANETSLSMLYSIMGKSFDSGVKFNVETFYTEYVRKQNHYINGDDFDTAGHENGSSGFVLAKSIMSEAQSMKRVHVSSQASSQYKKPKPCVQDITRALGQGLGTQQRGIETGKFTAMNGTNEVSTAMNGMSKAPAMNRIEPMNSIRASTNRITTAPATNRVSTSLATNRTSTAPATNRITPTSKISTAPTNRITPTNRIGAPTNRITPTSAAPANRITPTNTIGTTNRIGTTSGRAPPYIPVRKAPTSVPVPVPASKNRAPPYIPVRRAPAYIPQSKRK